MLFVAQSASVKIIDRPWEEQPGEVFTFDLSEPEETNPDAFKTHREIAWIEVRIVSGVAYYAYCHNDPINKVDVLGLAEKEIVINFV